VRTGSQPDENPRSGHTFIRTATSGRDPGLDEEDPFWMTYSFPVSHSGGIFLNVTRMRRAYREPAGRKSTRRPYLFPDGSQWKRSRIGRGRSLLDDVFFSGQPFRRNLPERDQDAPCVPGASRMKIHPAALPFSGRQPGVKAGTAGAAVEHLPSKGSATCRGRPCAAAWGRRCRPSRAACPGRGRAGSCCRYSVRRR
jgi:hypothetical protein